MRAHKLLATALAALVGASAVFACMPLVGYTMALAAPAGLLPWLSGATSAAFASFLWELLVVFVPTLGLVLLLCALVLRRILRPAGVAASMALAAGAMIALYVFIPIVFDTPFIRPLAWWASAAEASVIVASAATLPILRQKQG